MVCSTRFKFLSALLFAALLPGQAAAYIGPGAGLGAIAVTVALGLGILLLIVGLVWYPLKRLLKGKSGGNASENSQPGTE